MFLEVIIHVTGMSFSDIKWDIREESTLIAWAYFFFFYEEGLSRKRLDKVDENPHYRLCSRRNIA